MKTNKRIWLVALGIGLGTAVPLALCVTSAPWLIALPIIFGAIFVAALELVPNNCRDGTEGRPIGTGRKAKRLSNK
jgi:hypothetical protein